MADEIPEHELNEWLKTLFFALEPANVSARTNYQLLTRARRFLTQNSL